MADDISELGLDASDLITNAGRAAQALDDMAVKGARSLVSLTQSFDSNGKKIAETFKFMVDGVGAATVKLSESVKGGEKTTVIFKGVASQFNEAADAARKLGIQLVQLGNANKDFSKLPKASDYGVNIPRADLSKISKDVTDLDKALKTSGLSAKDLGAFLSNLSKGKIFGDLTPQTKAIGDAFVKLQKDASVLTDPGQYIKDVGKSLTNVQNLGFASSKVIKDNFALSLVPPSQLKIGTPSEKLRVQEAGEKLTGLIRETKIPREQLPGIFTQAGLGKTENLKGEALGLARAYEEVTKAVAAVGSAVSGATTKQRNFIKEAREGLDVFTLRASKVAEKRLGTPSTISTVTPEKTEGLQIGYIGQLRSVGREAQLLNASTKDIDTTLKAALGGANVAPLKGGLESLRFEFVKLIDKVNAFNEANTKALSASKGTDYRAKVEKHTELSNEAKRVYEDTFGKPVSFGIDPAQQAVLNTQRQKAFASVGTELSSSKASYKELVDTTQALQQGVGSTVPASLTNLKNAIDAVTKSYLAAGEASRKAFDIRNATAARANVSQYAANKEQVNALLPKPVLANVPPIQAEKLYSAFDTIASKAAQAALNIKASAGEIQQAFVSALSGTPLENKGLQKFVDIIRTATELTTRFDAAVQSAFSKEFAVPQREGKQLLGQQIQLAKSTYEGVAGPSTISPILPPEQISIIRKQQSDKLLAVAQAGLAIKAAPADYLTAAKESIIPSGDKDIGHLTTLINKFKDLGLSREQAGVKGVAAEKAVIIELDKESQRIQSVLSQLIHKAQTKVNLPEADTAVRKGARETFGPLPSSATLASTQRYNEIVDRLTHSLASGTVTVNQYAQALRNVASKAPINPNASETVKELTKNISDLGTVTANATQRTGLFAGAYGKLADQFRIASRLATYRIFSDLNNVMVEGIRAASELGQKIALIRTITQDQPASTQAWTKSVRELSDQFGQPITEVASAGYDTLSNQVAQNAEQTQKFLATISEFARTTGSSLNDSVGIFTTAIKGFGVDISESEHVASLFFNTIDYGRVTAEGLNAVLGRTGPLARDLGVSLEEVSAALTLLTLKGFNPQEAGTRVANFLLAFEKPSAEFKKFLSSYGVDDGKGFITVTGGMAGAINELAKAAESGSVTVSALFPEIRKLQAAVGLATDGGKEYAEALKNISTQQATYQAAKGITSDTFAQRFKEETTRLQNVVTVDIAAKLQQIFISVSDLIGGFSTRFKQIIDVVIVAGSAVTGFYVASLALKGLVSIYGALVTAWKAITAAEVEATAANVAFTLSSSGGAVTQVAPKVPIIPLIGVGVASAAAGYLGVDALIRKLRDDYVTLLEELDKKVKVNIDVNVDEFKSRLGAMTSEIDKDLKAWNSLYSRQAASVINILETQFAKHKNLLKDVENQTGNVFKLTLSSLERGIQGIENAAKKASDYSNEAKQKAKDASLDFERNHFQTAIGAAQGDFQAAGGQGVSVNEAALTINRINLLKQRAEALGKEAETNPAVLERYNATLQEAFQLANGLHNSFVQQRGSYNDIIGTARIRLSVENLILQSINNQAIAQAKFAEDAANKSKKQRELFEQVKDDYKKFEDLSLVNEKTGKALEPEIVGGVEVKSRKQKGLDRIDELDKLKAKILKGIDDINKITGTVNIPERIDINSTLNKQVAEFRTAIDKFEDAKKSIGKEALDISNVETGIQKLTTDITKATKVIEDNQNQLTRLTGQYAKLSLSAESNVNKIGGAIGGLGSTAFGAEPDERSLAKASSTRNAFKDLLAPIQNLQLNPEKAPDVLKQLEAFEAKSKLFSTEPIIKGKNEKGEIEYTTLGDLIKLIKIDVQKIADLIPELDKRKETLTSTQINVKDLQNQKKSIEEVLSGSLPQALTGTAAEFNALKESLSKDAPALSKIINTLTTNIGEASNKINEITKANTPLSKPEEEKFIPPARATSTPISESTHVGPVIPYESSFTPPEIPTPLLPPGFIQEESKGGLISPYFTQGGLTPDFPAEPSGINYSESAGGLIAAYQEGGMITRQPYKGDVFKDISGRNIHYLYEKGGLTKNSITKYYAQGGFTPKGTDIIPAMLSPNEFVMPADKTDKYRTTLESMKSGIYKDRYFDQGGDTSLKDSIAITKRNLGSGIFTDNIIASMIDDATQGYKGGLVKYLAEGSFPQLDHPQLDLSQIILKYLNSIYKNITTRSSIKPIISKIPKSINTILGAQKPVHNLAILDTLPTPPKGYIQTLQGSQIGLSHIERPNTFYKSNTEYKPDFSLPIPKGPYTTQFGTNPAPSQKTLDELVQRNTDTHKINIEANERTLLADKIAVNDAKVIKFNNPGSSYEPYSRLPYSRGPYTGNNPPPTQKELDSYIEEQRNLHLSNITTERHVNAIQRVAASDANKILKENPGTKYKPYFDLPIPKGPYTSEYGNNPPPKPKDLFNQLEEARNRHKINIEAEQRINNTKRGIISESIKPIELIKSNIPANINKSDLIENYQTVSKQFDALRLSGKLPIDERRYEPSAVKKYKSIVPQTIAPETIQSKIPKRPDIIQPIVPPYPTPVLPNIPEGVFAPSPATPFVASPIISTPVASSFAPSVAAPLVPTNLNLYAGGLTKYYEEGGITNPDNIINELLLQWNAKEGSSLGSARKASDTVMKLIEANPKGAQNLSERLHSTITREKLVSAAERQGYPVGQITPASFNFALKDYKGITPEIIKDQKSFSYSALNNAIKVGPTSKISLDKLGSFRHELEHSKQQTSTYNSIDPQFLRQVYQPTAEIPASLGDIIHTASIFQQHTGKPLVSKVIVAPGIVHDASFIAKQAEKHGFLEGKSTTELLATPSGQAYLTRLLNASSTTNTNIVNKSMGGESTRGIIGLGNYSQGGVSFENYNSSDHVSSLNNKNSNVGFENYYSSGGDTKNYSDIAQQCFNNSESNEKCDYNLRNSNISAVHKYKGGLTKYYQDGGVVDQSTFISKGSDTIPAMLTPKEYVVSTKGTSRFLKELTLMNQGIDPQYHSDGGVTFNDYNMSDHVANISKANNNVGFENYFKGGGSYGGSVYGSSYGSLPTYAQGLQNQLTLQAQYRSDVAGLQNLAVDPISSYQPTYSKPSNFSHNYQDGGSINNKFISDDVAISNLVSHFNIESASTAKGSAHEASDKIMKLIIVHSEGAQNLLTSLHDEATPAINLISAAKEQGYPVGQVTPASLNIALKSYQGKTPNIEKSLDTSRYVAKTNTIYLNSKPESANLDKVTVLSHELEHAKQQTTFVNNKKNQEYFNQLHIQTADIPASLGSLAVIPQAFKQHLGKSLDAKVEVAPGITHSSDFIAKQAEKYGLFTGKSMTEILATPSGQSYLTRLLDASKTENINIANKSYGGIINSYAEGGLTDPDTALSNIVSHWNIEGVKSSIGKDKDASDKIVKLMTNNPSGAINLVNKLHTESLRKSIVDYAVSKGYPSSGITKESIDTILHTYQGSTPIILPHQTTSNFGMIESPLSRIGIKTFDKPVIALTDKESTHLDRLGALHHELEHAKQVVNVGNITSPKDPNFAQNTTITAAEIPPSLGDIPYAAQVFKQHMKEPLNFPVKLSPNITQDADWMAKQAEKHGLFSGRSTTELLATPSGQSYLTRLLNDSVINKSMGGLSNYGGMNEKNISNSVINNLSTITSPISSMSIGGKSDSKKWDSKNWDSKNLENKYMGDMNEKNIYNIDNPISSMFTGGKNDSKKWDSKNWDSKISNTKNLEDKYNYYQGGLVKYFQEGGKNIFVPKGTDTIPAMLSPNEFVVSTKGSLKFLPQLEMMNQGIDPWKMYAGGLVKYFQDGGDVTENQIINSDNQTINTNLNNAPNISDISNQITSKVSGTVDNINTNVSKANNVVEKLHSNVVNSSSLSNKLNEQSTVANTAYKNLGGSLSKVSNVDSKIQTNINNARSTSSSLSNKVSSANSVSESLASKIGIAKSLIKQLDNKTQSQSSRPQSPQAQASQNFDLTSQGFVNIPSNQPGSETQALQSISASAGLVGNYGTSNFGGVSSGAADSVATATGIDFSTFAFAKGGMISNYYSKGTDTIPAMLSPKEYVINAASTSKFLPQLESMNKGIDPYTFPEYHAEGGMIASFTPQVLTPSTNYYNEGGSVQSHTTNVGDIHLNVTHTSKDPNFGKTIAEQIRREIRKGSIDKTFFQ